MTIVGGITGLLDPNQPKSLLVYKLGLASSVTGWYGAIYGLLDFGVYTGTSITDRV